MIVPGSRLLQALAFFVAPVILLGAAFPELQVFMWLLAGGFALVALGDAFFGRKRLAKVNVQLQPAVSLFKDRAGELSVDIFNGSSVDLTLRIALALPWEIKTSHDVMTVPVPAGALTLTLSQRERKGKSGTEGSERMNKGEGQGEGLQGKNAEAVVQEATRLAWPCVPRKRGKYKVSLARAETLTRLGFWMTRKNFQVDCEVKVYPNLLHERGQVLQLLMHRGSFGLHAQRIVGKGRDFEKLRDYSPGDDLHDVHWKATAKRNRVVSKVYQVERTQEIYVVVDTSRLSARTPLGASQQVSRRDEKSPVDGETAALPPTVLEQFILSSLVLALAAEEQRDLYGLVTFNDRVRSFLRARNGKAHYGHCRESLYMAQPELVTPDFGEVFTALRLRLRRRALLVFLASLDDPLISENFLRHLHLISPQHLVVACMIQPPGARPFLSNPEVSSVEGLYHELSGQMLWQELRQLEKTLAHRGVQFAVLPREGLSAELVSRYLQIKRRQLL